MEGGGIEGGWQGFSTKRYRVLLDTTNRAVRYFVLTKNIPENSDDEGNAREKWGVKVNRVCCL